MPICQNCKEKFPCKVEINGKKCHSPGRKYCYTCNPIGARNFWGTKKTKVLKAKEDGIFIPEKHNRGKIYYPRKFVCKVCGKKKYQKTNGYTCSGCKGRLRRQARKLKAIELLGGRCEKCGYNKCKEALDFHHTNSSEKELAISSAWGCPWKTIEKELKKCILLCCRCHTELHYLPEK